MKNRLLVTGGAIGDLEIISAAKELGYFVVTSGNRPDDPGHKLSDVYVACDYTNVRGLISICTEYNIKYIVPSAHDLAAITAAKVAYELNLPGYDHPSISTLIHDKSKLRNLWSSLGGRTPRFVSSSSILKLFLQAMRLKMPLIIKPTSLTGGAGISVSKNRISLLTSIRNALSQPGSQGAIIEEFLSGTNHGLTCLLINQRVVFFAHDDEFHIYDQFRVSATTFPSKNSDLDISPLIKEIEHFARKTNLVDGIFHTQYLMTKSGPVLLEACRRTPGDAYTKFVSVAFNFNYALDIVLGFTGQAPRAFRASKSPATGIAIGRFILMPEKVGSLLEICNPEFSNLLWESDFRKVGDLVEDNRKWTAKIYIFRSKRNIVNENFYRALASNSKVITK